MHCWLGEIAGAQSRSSASRTGEELRAGRNFWGALQSAGFIALVMAVMATGTRIGLGARLPPRFLVTLAVGAFIAQWRPDLARLVAVLVGVLALTTLNPVFGAYFLALMGALTATRNRAGPFAAILIGGAIVLPKLAFSRGYHTPGLWNWFNEPSLALALFVSALWWRAQIDAANPPGPTRAAAAGDSGAGAAGAAGRAVDLAANPTSQNADALSFLLLYFFPTHATNPMVFGPTVLWRPLRANLRAVVTLMCWFLLKVVALVILHRAYAGSLLRDLSPSRLADLSRLSLWGVVAASYVETFLVLAASADVPIVMARLFGWPLTAAFRAPLLAWNPVELWRRWGIYNRQFLLKVVYFPLGGNRHHRYRNIVLTFLASALVLHSGWFGSKYWEVGVAGWRDESLYFLLQAFAVCGCLAVWQWAGKNVASDRNLRVSPGRVLLTIATQGYSALAHVVILAQGVDLATRFRLIGRCLGL